MAFSGAWWADKDLVHAFFVAFFYPELQPDAQTKITLRDNNQPPTSNPEPEKQVKSKKRVIDHGEVFTAEREVNAMLDLVKQETERIDSRFLGPACGDGNFLVEILRPKLVVVESRYSKSQLGWERYAVNAVSSIYGVDILKDNVHECRERLFVIFETQYNKAFKGGYNTEYLNSM